MADNAFRICPLASGSKGNSLFVSRRETALLVDAGLSGVETERRLNLLGIDPASLTAIVITHEHADHVKGAGILSRRYHLPVYITRGTHAACQGMGRIDHLRFFECGTPFSIDGIQISPFSISHDAEDPVGLTLEDRTHKIGIATDLGVVTHLVREHLKNSSLLYLESNHDAEMLINGPYPWHLKQRIKGRTGHLSNDDAGRLVSELQSRQLRHVILAHLSEENNCPQKAIQAVSQALNGSGVGLHVAMPHEPGRMITLQD